MRSCIRSARRASLRSRSMPCYDPVPTDRQKRAFAARQFMLEVVGVPYDHKAYSRLNQEQSLAISDKTLDSDTEYLCLWCKSNPNRIKNMSLDFQLWWREHQELDKERGGHDR